MINNSENSAGDVADVLLNSGWLTDKVIIGALNRTPALNDVNKSIILMKNSPFTPQTMNLIEQHELNEVVISLIQEGYLMDTATTRFDMLHDIYYMQREKELAYNQWLYHAAVNSSVNMSHIIDTLGNETEPVFKMKLFDLLLALKEYNDAVEVFNTIQEDDNEIVQWKNLRSITLEMLSGERTWFDLGTENLPYLEEIEEIASSNTQAAFQAQAVLTLVYDSVYNELILEKDGGGGAPRKGRFDDNAIEDESLISSSKHDYRLKPNLFEDKLLATITLKEDEEGILEIYNLQGLLIGNVTLNKGANELDLTPMNLPNGIYVYRVWALNQLKHTDKLVKLK
jgi:hypothetical protein